jgi:hypothetical protein
MNQFGADLALDDLWRNAVPSSVRGNSRRHVAVRSRREVDHGEPAARLQ